ncbi:peroxisomal protein [Meredithblackwellia eburnea MCA 4105]
MSVEGWKQAITTLILDPKYQPILAILKGARNGFVYGVRVRAPHALVMTILFRSGSWQDKLKFIFKATKQHALNLARFVTIYKTTLLAQKVLGGGKERSSDTFFAGLLGGWLVFGERNAVNEQIVLYVVSRVITSLLPRATPPAAPKPLQPPTGAGSRPPNNRIFELYAAVTWGAVMWLFKERRDRLHGGMVSSMQYLYLDSEVWSSLRNLVWRAYLKPHLHPETFFFQSLY